MPIAARAAGMMYAEESCESTMQEVAMSLSPNPDAPLEEGDPTEMIEPATTEQPAAGDTDATIVDPGPADPRPATESGDEFDTTIAPHFL
jgi:hypothetical protein